MVANREPDLVIDPEPGMRLPAPGRLRLVQQFVNTNDREGGEDQFDDPEMIGRWLSHWTAWPAGAILTAEERVRVIAIREGIRGLALTVAPIDAVFDDAIRWLDIRLGLHEGRLSWVSSSRMGKVIGPILDAVRTAMDDGSWSRMKTCQRDRCQWLYYDSSRNNSSKWCATDVCGSREKAARAYRRTVAKRRRA